MATVKPKTAGAAASDVKAAQTDKDAQAEGTTTGATETAAGAAPLAAPVAVNEQADQPAYTAEQLPAEAAGQADALQQVGLLSDTQIEELKDPLKQDRGLLTSIAWPPQLCDVRILAPVTIRDVRYQPNTVLEGLPLALVEAHLGSVDPHPDAVAYARANDGEVVQFQGPDQEEAEDQE